MEDQNKYEGNQVEASTEQSQEDASPDIQPSKNKKIIAIASVAALALGVFLFNQNKGPSKEQCDRIMLTQIFFDGRVSAASIGTISGLELVTAWTAGLEDLGNAVEDLNGSAKEDGDQIFTDAAGVGIALSTGSGMAQSYYDDMTSGYEDFDATYCR